MEAVRRAAWVERPAVQWMEKRWWVELAAARIGWKRWGSAAAWVARRPASVEASRRVGAWVARRLGLGAGAWVAARLFSWEELGSAAVERFAKAKEVGAPIELEMAAGPTEWRAAGETIEPEAAAAPLRAASQ